MGTLIFPPLGSLGVFLLQILQGSRELSGFLCSSAGKESACNAGDLGLIPGLERCPGEEKGYPLQYSGLENSVDLYSPWGCKESDTIEQLSLHFRELSAKLLQS